LTRFTRQPWRVPPCPGHCAPGRVSGPPGPGFPVGPSAPARPRCPPPARRRVSPAGAASARRPSIRVEPAAGRRSGSGRRSCFKSATARAASSRRWDLQHPRRNSAESSGWRASVGERTDQADVEAVRVIACAHASVRRPGGPGTPPPRGRRASPAHSRPQPGEGTPVVGEASLQARLRAPCPGDTVSPRLRSSQSVEPTGYIETRYAAGGRPLCGGIVRDSEARDPSGGSPRLGGGARRARLLLDGACGTKYCTRGCLLPFTPANRHSLLANRCEFEWGYELRTTQ
jgi:hypothetical protein